jgi:hypothetical protein
MIGTMAFPLAGGSTNIMTIRHTCVQLLVAGVLTFTGLLGSAKAQNAGPVLAL